MAADLIEVTGVKVLGHYRLRLTFSDGRVGDVDVSPARASRQHRAQLAIAFADANMTGSDQIRSGTMSMAPHGHSATHMPQP